MKRNLKQICIIFVESAEHDKKLVRRIGPYCYDGASPSGIFQNALMASPPLPGSQGSDYNRIELNITQLETHGQKRLIRSLHEILTRRIFI